MNRIHAWLPAFVLAALGVFAGYRMLAMHQADRWAASDPSLALKWMPRHPQALLALAEQQLAAGRIEEARASARRLLAVEPLQGRGFRVLAAAAAVEGKPTEALALYRIAARRSPRDIATRAWLIEHFMAAGDYAAAFEHIDALLRIAPKQGNKLLPLLASAAADPGFAAELARKLQRRPPWRDELLASLRNTQDPVGMEAVMSALRREGGLSETEFDDWIAGLIRQGRWGEAYSRWAGTLAMADGVLPLVYNGQFELPVSHRGFDWRLVRVPGVSVEFVPDAGTKGLSAHVSFRNRQVPQVGLEQPMLLSPGHYRFSARARADILRSDRGLAWGVSCDRQPSLIGTSERMEGSFGWRTVVMDIVVPASGCDGQWLRLLNPAPSGSAQQVSGDLWLDDVAIQRQAGSP